jgi:hypothetical protein
MSLRSATFLTAALAIGGGLPAHADNGFNIREYLPESVVPFKTCSQDEKGNIVLIRNNDSGETVLAKSWRLTDDGKSCFDNADMDAASIPFVAGGYTAQLIK